MSNDDKKGSTRIKLAIGVGAACDTDSGMGYRILCGLGKKPFPIEIPMPHQTRD